MMAAGIARRTPQAWDGEQRTIICEDNKAVAPLQLLVVPRVEVKAVISLAHKATQHSLLKASPHIPA